MNVSWILLFVGVAVGAAAVRYAAWRRRIDTSDCGTVSDQWLAEQRTHDRHYSER